MSTNPRPQSQPQSTARGLDETIEALPDQVAPVRSRVARFAAAVGATPVQADAVRLAVSEAITNAVVHAYPEDPGTVTVQAWLADHELWVLVGDDGVGLEPEARRPGLGLGLGLISQLSDDLAIVARASGGTELRIRFDLAPDRDRPQDASPPAGGGSGIDVGTPRGTDLTAWVLAA